MDIFFNFEFQTFTMLNISDIFLNLKAFFFGKITDSLAILHNIFRRCHGCDGMVVGFATIYAISTYQH